MMENGTVTPFPVKMSIKEEGGGPFSTMVLLTLGNPDQTPCLSLATSPGPCESTTGWQSGGHLLRGNLVGSSSTRILSWKLDEGELPFPS